MDSDTITPSTSTAKEARKDSSRTSVSARWRPRSVPPRALAWESSNLATHHDYHHQDDSFPRLPRWSDPGIPPSQSRATVRLRHRFVLAYTIYGVCCLKRVILIVRVLEEIHSKHVDTSYTLRRRSYTEIGDDSNKPEENKFRALSLHKPTNVCAQILCESTCCSDTHMHTKWSL